MNIEHNTMFCLSCIRDSYQRAYPLLSRARKLYNLQPKFEIRSDDILENHMLLKL